MTGPNFGDNNIGDNAAAVNARLDQWVADAKAKAQRYQEMQAEVSRVSATESSPDGVVAVTVDANGALTDLRITDRVRELSGAQVAAAVLATIKRAQSRLPDRVAEVMQSTVGDDQAAVDIVLANYRGRFPEAEEPEQPRGSDEYRLGRLAEDDSTPPPRPPRPAPRRRPADEDDGWDAGGSVLRRGDS
jgi:DNA-binding protein YbaB